LIFAQILLKFHDIESWDIGDEDRTYIYLSKKVICLFCHIETSQTTTPLAMPLAPWESP